MIGQSTKAARFNPQLELPTDQLPNYQLSDLRAGGAGFVERSQRPGCVLASLRHR